MPNLKVTTPVVIFGLGQTGLSAARFYAERDINFSLIDTRAAPPEFASLADEFPSAPIITEIDAASELYGCETLVLSPGVPRELPLVNHAIESGVEVIGDIELFARTVKAPIVAVTGSNGKSTVVTLISAILAEAGMDVRTGGNIGTPALELIDADEPEAYVLELSSFQLESTANLNAEVAVILNIAPDHMDRYADFAAYASAKLRIIDGAKSVVFNADDATLNKFEELGSALRVSGSSRNADYFLAPSPRDGREALWARGQELLSVDELKLRGGFNLHNALVAIAVTDHFAVDAAAQRSCLRQFQGLAHRCEQVATINGVDWFDDSKGTNVAASCAAIESVFANRSGVLIAGGQAKGATFEPLAACLRETVRAVVLIGEDAPLLEKVLAGIAPLHSAIDMNAAVSLAAALAQTGDAVLLSPACASLDMFNGFVDRGRAFRRAIAEVATA